VFKADTYTKIYGKLVLRFRNSSLILEATIKDVEQFRLERYYLGGDGLANFAMDDEAAHENAQRHGQTFLSR
jgi:outer membrane protein insertion porin family